MTQPHPLRTRLRALWNWRNGLALLLLVACLAIALQLERSGWLTVSGFRQLIHQLGIWGPLTYMGVLILSVVISPIPSAPLAMVAGAVWGGLLAGIYSVVGGFIGGLLAYWLGYSLGRSALVVLTGKVIYFSKHRGEIFLGWLIFISRLFPIFSFDLISYSAGVAGLAFPIYVSATLFGMIPSTFLLTYLGAALTISLPWAVLFLGIFLIVMVGLPWAMQRYNWLGLRDVVHLESAPTFNDEPSKDARSR